MRGFSVATRPASRGRSRGEKKGNTGFLSCGIQCRVWPSCAFCARLGPPVCVRLCDRGPTGRVARAARPSRESWPVGAGTREFCGTSSMWETTSFRRVHGARWCSRQGPSSGKLDHDAPPAACRALYGFLVRALNDATRIVPPTRVHILPCARGVGNALLAAQAAASP